MRRVNISILGRFQGRPRSEGECQNRDALLDEASDVMITPVARHRAPSFILSILFILSFSAFRLFPSECGRLVLGTE